MRSALSSLPGVTLPSRYDLLFPLAAGGTASVHLGRLRGIAGFWRLVAVKVAHEHLTEDPACREMMVEEARIASKIHHPNVVPVIDIDQCDGRLLLVMEYIEGTSLSELLRAASGLVPARIAVRIALDACAGLHAAHSLKDASGQSLDVVHRDVSPQNILLGTDGVARVTDFGIAKTSYGKGRSAVGTLKGKLAYMAPEYVLGSPANAGSDVFGLAVVVWEMLVGRRLFRGENGHETLSKVLHHDAAPISKMAPALGTDLDAVLAMALAKSPKDRFRSAKAFGAALEASARKSNMIATSEEVRELVLGFVGDTLIARRRRIGELIANEQSANRTPSDLPPAAREEETAREVPSPRVSCSPNGAEITKSDVRVRPTVRPPVDLMDLDSVDVCLSLRRPQKTFVKPANETSAVEASGSINVEISVESRNTVDERRNTSESDGAIADPCSTDEPDYWDECSESARWDAECSELEHPAARCSEYPIVRASLYPPAEVEEISAEKAPISQPAMSEPAGVVRADPKDPGASSASKSTAASAQLAETAASADGEATNVEMPRSTFSTWATRIRRDRTFQVVAVAAFVIGGLMKMLLTPAAHIAPSAPSTGAPVQAQVEIAQ